MSMSRNIELKNHLNIINQFSELSEIQNLPHPEITPAPLAKLISSQLSIFLTFNEKSQTTAVILLRELLLKIYNMPSISKIYINEKHFKQVIADILLCLSEAYPTNKINNETNLLIDPKNQKSIDKNDCFYTLTGTAFSIDALLEFNKSQKHLLDPTTMQSMSEYDIERLILIAGHKKKKLDFVANISMDEKAINKNLSELMTYRQIAELAQGKTVKQSIDLSDELPFNAHAALALVLIASKYEEARVYNALRQLAKDKIDDLLKNPEKIPKTLPLDATSLQSFIIIASHMNDYKTLKELCDLATSNNISIQKTFGKIGYHALHVASQFGSFAAALVLLTPKYKFDVNSQDKYGQTAAFLAGDHKHYNILSLLAEKKANVMIPKADGEALIHVAADRNDTTLLKLLIKYKANLNQIAGYSSYKRTALHMAVENDHKEVVELLLANNADLNVIDEQGYTPVHKAAYSGSNTVMKIFLKHKDKFDLTQALKNEDTPETLAGLAAQNNHVGTLKLLAENKADLQQIRIDDGTTPLHRAAFANSKDATKFLIQHYQNNIFIKNKKGESPFFVACAKKHWALAKLFLGKANIKHMSKNDKELMKKFSLELEAPIKISMFLKPSEQNGIKTEELGSTQSLEKQKPHRGPAPPGGPSN